MEAELVEHYGAGRLLASIEAGLAALGKSPADVTVEDLGPVDEFHVGGRAATGALTRHLDLDEGCHLLDVGCGIGGTARQLASTTGCRVTGLDLVPEFVEVARALTEWTGLDDRIGYEVGSALAMPFEAASFDAATQLHVGMNVADKGALFAEVRRVLRPGATLAVYDLLKTGEGTIDYPVPWASAASTSALGDLDAYENAMSAAGFDVVTIEDRRDFALGFFAEMKARAEARGGPPPIGVHLIFGRAAPEKLTNMVRAIGSGTIAPTEIVAVAR